MSSQYDINRPPAKCIDGVKDGGSSDICHTQSESAPWLAIEFDKKVSVSKVVIYNRKDGSGERLRNVEVRVTNVLPTSGSTRFTGGQLLGTFDGPGSNGQIIPITSADSLCGKYVLVQMTLPGGETDVLNLLEVTASGVPSCHGELTFHGH